MVSDQSNLSAAVWDDDSDKLPEQHREAKKFQSAIK